MTNFKQCKKYVLLIALLITLLLCSGVIFFGINLYAGSTVEIQEFVSKELKDHRGVHEKNKIYFKPGIKEDIWIMRQTPSDSGLPESKRDMLAIRVKKGKASFYQLQPDSSLEPESWEYKTFRAPCGVCHTNGPRAIRPKKDLGAWGQLKVFTVNMRIKTYGKLANQVGRESDKKDFHYLEKDQIKSLNLASCTKCHSDTGIRAALTNEQWSTMKHLVETNSMPPSGHSK